MNALDYPVQHFELMLELSQSLRESEAQVQEHHYVYSSFGSWWVSFRTKAGLFRFVYDGRDSCISLDRATVHGTPEWHSVLVRVARSDQLSDVVRTVLAEMSAG